MEDTTKQEVVIGRVKKNFKEDVCVSVGEFKGNVYIHSRIWINSEDGQIPTVRGLTIRADVCAQMIPLLQKAVEKAAEFGVTYEQGK